MRVYVGLASKCTIYVHCDLAGRDTLIHSTKDRALQNRLNNNEIDAKKYFKSFLSVIVVVTFVPSFAIGESIGTLALQASTVAVNW